MRKDGRRIPAFAEFVIRLSIQPFSRVMWRPKLISGQRFLDIEKPCFVYGNHSHIFDPFILNIFTHWNYSTAGVISHEFFRGKIMSWGMGGIDLIPTQKQVPEPHIIRKIYKYVQQDERSFLIYPEGGRRWAGQPIPWIDSTAKIFVKMGVPIYPVFTHGSYVAWPRWADYPRPAKMKLELCEPIHFDRKTPIEEALAKLKAPMDIDENLVDDDIKPKWAYRPASGIHRLLYRDLESGINGGMQTTDGTYVTNDAGTIRYKMLPDSTLLDEKSGEVFTTGSLYNKVRTLPIEADKQGIIIQNQVVLHDEAKFPSLKGHGDAQITLRDDAVHIKGQDYDETVGLENILYMGTEKKTKVQLFTKEKMYQFTFNGDGSALQWQDTIKRMQDQHSSTAVPVTETAK